MAASAPSSPYATVEAVELTRPLLPASEVTSTKYTDEHYVTPWRREGGPMIVASETPSKHGVVSTSIVTS